MFDENLTWTKHINQIENKISKSLGMLYRAKYLLDKNCLKNIYFSFIHTYINYGNVAWGSTSHTKLKKIFTTQKQASRIISHADKHAHARPLLRDLGILNVYQLNIYQNLLLFYKANHGISPRVFWNKFQKPNHRYPTRSISENYYKIPKSTLKQTWFSLSIRGPFLWNKVLNRDLKLLQNVSIFKTKVKETLLSLDCELSFY